ncbi:MAG: SRPBCC domain-containing protein [Deltaproteobacteria bacterium]|nr:SRPBCC domain-containing protein [Deltaproteobacteria bacterium]
MSEVKMRACATAKLNDDRIVASVDIAAPPERTFRALASEEIVDWWVNPGAFDTREWAGEVKVGGWWRASGMARGQPYTLEGEFLEVDPPRKLVHTWHRVGAPEDPSIVTYLLEPIPRRHASDDKPFGHRLA